MNYACLTNQSFQYKEYQLLPIRHQDMPLIKEWRNAQMAFLRQSEPLTDQMQERYYQQVLVPAFALPKPPQLLFSFLQLRRCIGYGGLVHIDWTSHRAEVSFLLETERSQRLEEYKEEFSIFLQLVKQLAFEELHLHRLFTETFDIRPAHLSILEQSGFAFEGRMKEHVRIENKFVDSLIHGCINEYQKLER